MTNITHILETTLLVLAVYLFGCVVGYAARRILHAGRGTRVVTAEVVTGTRVADQAVLRSRRVMTPAARLAAASTDDMPNQIVAIKDRPATGKAKRAEPKPDSMSQPRSSGRDDLKQIKGIGPKIEASLNGLGVYHFDQIAAWSKANIAWVDKQLALRGRIGRERWVEQATQFGGDTKMSA